MKKFTIKRRITPFILCLCFGMVVTAAAAQPTGRWLFIDDESGIDIAPCPAVEDGVCGTLVQLPKVAAPLTAAEKKQLCGSVMIGSLKAVPAKSGELFRLDGWVINPEDLARTDAPKRYNASLISTSDVSARLDVRGPFGIVLENHRLMRPVAFTNLCR